MAGSSISEAPKRKRLQRRIKPSTRLDLLLRKKTVSVRIDLQLAIFVR